MSELRWILVILGLCVVAGIYLWGRRRTRPRERTPATTRVEPHLADEASWREPVVTDRDDAADMRSVGSGMEQGQGVSAEQQRIVALHIRAPAGETLSGTALEEAFSAEGLDFGEYEAFHYRTQSGRSQFTVVSMVEPGSFPKDRMDDFATPGLTMFMVATESDSVETLSMMIACARRLASRLDAEVLDQDGSTFTNQRAAHMKEEIVEYLRQTRLGAGSVDRP